MARSRFEMVWLTLLVISMCASIAHSKNLPKRENRNNFNYHYQKTGEILKTDSSNGPYAERYIIDQRNPENDAEESANFGSYDIGNGGFIGGGYQGGGGGGFQGGSGYIGSGIQGGQYNSIGISGVGGGLGVGGGIGLGGGIGVGGGHLGGGGGYIGGIGIGGGGIGGGGIGGGGIGYHGGGGGGGYIQQPYIGGGGGGGIGYSGGYADKSQFGSSKKNQGDENVQKIVGSGGSQANQGNQGYNQGVAAVSKSNGDSGYYKDQVANKNQAGDGKSYQGSNYANKEANQGETGSTLKSHKKGHVTKGFKSFVKKDEEEKTETFYDEAHDEGDHKNFGQNTGSVGEKSESSFKGGHEQESLDAKTQAKEGQFNSQNKIEDSKANKGEFGQTAYKGNSEQFLKANNLGAQSILGQQEQSGEYHSKKPYGILPIHARK